MHLKSYPEAYQKLERFEEVFSERVRELFHKYGHRIRTPDRFMMMHFEKKKGKGFLGKIFGETVLVKDDVPYMIDWGPEEPTEEEMKEINELRDFLDNTKVFNERFAVYRELAGDIAMLSLKVEMGQPLEGSCTICPKVDILEEGEGLKV